MRKTLKLFTLLVFTLSFGMILSNNVYADEAITVHTNAISITGEMYYLTDGTTSAHTHWFGATLDIGSFSIKDQVAFCGDHTSDSPDSDDYGTAYLYTKDTDGYNGSVAAILYYGYGGLGQVTSSTRDGYYATTYLLFRILKGATDWSVVMDLIGDDAEKLYEHMIAQDAPDDFAYVLWYPDDETLQIIGFSAGIIQRGRAQLHKYDLDYSRNLKGDATLEGITYGVYAAEDIYESDTLLFKKDELIVEVQTDENGDTPEVPSKDGVIYDNDGTEKYIKSSIASTTLNGLPEGNYYWQETSSNSSYVLNDEKIEFTVTADELVEKDAYDKVNLGKVSVIKYDEDNQNEDDEEYDTEKNSAYGAVLRLRLVSAIGTDEEERNTYYATIDENGYAEFYDEEYLAMYPDAEYTIPYGVYELDEVEASENGKHTYFYIQSENIEIDENEDEEQRIVSDEPIPAYLKIIKKDADTGEIVELSGAKFMIWDVENDEWVTFKSYPDFSDITEIVANESGYVVTPQQLQPGTYVIYETQAPDGYYLEDSLRVPDNEDYLGNVDYGGIEVIIDDSVLIDGEKTYIDDTSGLYKEVEISDRPLKVSLEVYKTGEVFANVSTSNTEYGEKVTPVWQEQGLAGATYNLIATEDIMSPDGKHTYVTAGTTYTATTDEDGVASFEELYPGTYTLVEVEAPEGYVLDTQERTITLTNDDSLERVKVESISLTDTRQKLELTFKKIFEEIEYSATTQLEQTAVFGVYAGEDIKNYAGTIVISKDTLVDVITVTGNNPDATSTVDLPEGTYYVQELDTSYPYVVSDEVQYFTLEYTSDGTQEFVVIEGNDFENEAKSAPLILLKLSTSSANAEGVLSLVGSEIDDETLETLSDLSLEIYNLVKDLSVDETIAWLESYLAGEIEDVESDGTKVITVAGAIYQIFVDEECTEPLYTQDPITGEYTVEVTFTTDESGMVLVENIPYGTYYVKEIEGNGYEVSGDVIQIVVNETTGIPKVFQVTYDDSVSPTSPPSITKLDIFTGDAVPDCTFEITDEDGNVLVHATTDEDGNAYFPVDVFENGATYYYTEISAPDIYELDTEPHAFVAEYDEEYNWTAEIIQVTNVRKTGTVQIIKSDADTGERLAGCVFTIVLLDDDGNEYVNADGETIYLVQNAVTDENGEYLIEDAPYGTYKFVEMVAPEGYELDEDMTGLTFTVSDDSNYIVFEVTNTGDIAVIAITGVLILSIAGIVSVVLRRKLANRV